MAGTLHERIRFISIAATFVAGVGLSVFALQIPGNIAARYSGGVYDRLFPATTASDVPGTGWPGESKQSELGVSTRILVLQAMADGRQQIPVIIAANRAETGTVAQLVRQIGGQVLTTIPQIGYLRAVIPTEKCWWLIQQTSVTDFSVAGYDGFSPQTIREPRSTDESEKKVAAAFAAEHKDGKTFGDVDLDLPLLPAGKLETIPGLNANAYLQQPDWLQKHPTWDGRGVTIVSVEGMPGADDPPLQTAKDILGRPIPKIARVIDALDYEHPNPAGYFSSEHAQSDYFGELKLSSAANLGNGDPCPTPRSANEKVGVWKPVYYGDKTSEYCVIWDREKQVAHVDLNHNGTFADDPPLYDFNQKHSFLKIPATPGREGDGRTDHYFTAYLLSDRASGAVLLLSSYGDHSAMTATASAGTGFMNTTVGGMAPGARLMFMNKGSRLSDDIEGMWKAADRTDTDLITSSLRMGGSNEFSEIPTIAMLFYDRISEITGKPIITAGGNAGLPFENVDDYGRLVISVGGYIHAEQMQAFRSDSKPLVLSQQEYVINNSSSGPYPNGSLAPDIVAPEVGIAGSDCGSDHYALPADHAQVGFDYRLPPCYAVSDGTSAAAPRVAGAVALLLSAAKQEHMRVTPLEIKRALITSSRYLSNEPAYRQGAGLMQVKDAWEALKEIVDHPTVTVTSSTRDILPLQPENWRGPVVGKSIYITRGFHPNKTKEISLDLDVTGIPAGNLSFKLLDSDGTYQISKINRGAGGKVEVVLNASAATVGNKSALLQVEAKGWRYPLARLPITMIATPSPEALSAGLNLHGSYQIELSSDSFFFEPPDDAADFEITASAIGGVLSVALTAPNAMLSYNEMHTLNSTMVLDGTQTLVVPSVFPDLIGLTTRLELPYPTTYDLTINTKTPSELEALAKNHHSYLTATSSQTLIPVEIPNAPIRGIDIPVPGNTDAAVISFPELNSRSPQPFTAEAFLYGPNSKGQQALWNYLPLRDSRSRFALPEPQSGTWKLFVTGSYSGPVNVAFLRTAAQPDASAGSYIPFGALCEQKNCEATWPVANPFWRSLPLRSTSGPH